MSINAAIAALNKEIEAVEKKKARLESMRNELIAEAGETYVSATSTATSKGKPSPKPGTTRKGKPGTKPAAVTKGKPGPKPGVAKKTSHNQLAVPTQKSFTKKRAMSAEAKKKIGEAAKARWAAKAATKKVA